MDSRRWSRNPYFLQLPPFGQEHTEVAQKSCKKPAAVFSLASNRFAVNRVVMNSRQLVMQVVGSWNHGCRHFVGIVGN